MADTTLDNPQVNNVDNSLKCYENVVDVAKSFEHMFKDGFLETSGND